jgi:hypothetical protein
MSGEMTRCGSRAANFAVTTPAKESLPASQLMAVARNHLNLLLTAQINSVSA